MKIFTTSRVNELIQYREKMEKQCEEFQKRGSYEMAFMSLWSINEHFLKSLALWIGQKEKYELMISWLSYLDNLDDTEVKNIERPKVNKIGDINVEPSISLPKQNFIEKQCPNGKTLLKIMDPNGKYRRKRNAIAHSADNLSKELFEEYLPVLITSINEIFGILPIE